MVKIPAAFPEAGDAAGKALLEDLALPEKRDIAAERPGIHERGLYRQTQTTRQQVCETLPVVTLVTMVGNQNAIVSPTLRAFADVGHPAAALLTDDDIAAAMVMADLTSFAVSVVHRLLPSLALGRMRALTSTP